MARRCKKIYTAAVIGCGRIGSLLEKDKLRGHPCTHAGVLAAHPRLKLVAGCDLIPERRARFAADWKIAPSHVYEDYRRLLRSEKPDLVTVATYTESHAAITIAAAKAGAKIILCEKPMALTLAEADRMINVCRRHGALLVIHHERRWISIYRTIRRMIATGMIGEVRTIVGNVLTGSPTPDWHALPQVAGGGPTMHDGTHLFDIIRYLCGEVVSVSGETEKADPELKVEDTGRAILRLRNGAVAFVECGGRRGYFNFELDIQGTLGRIQVGNAVSRFYSVGPSPRYENFVEFVERDFPAREQPDYFPYMVDDMIEAYETGRESLSSGEDGRAALALILALYGSREAMKLKR